MIKASTSTRPTPAILGQSSANGKTPNGTAPTSGGLKEIKEVAAKDPRIVVASVPPATEPTEAAPEPQPAPVVADAAALQPEAPKGPQLSEVEQVLAQFERMEKLTRNHARLKEVQKELEQFNFSPTEEVNNPVELIIQDREGHKFTTMNTVFVESLLQFLQQIVMAERVKNEEKLMTFKIPV